ncbi:MAG TPA: sugar transferase [Terriglobia bacterium]|nr:sugar transferase [Terriglobia bacterium]
MGNSSIARPETNAPSVEAGKDAAAVEAVSPGMEKRYGPAAKPLQRALKNALDFVGAMAGLVLLSPALLIIALCVKLDDGGTVLYRRRVVGQNGEFDAFKFRTMVTNAEAVLKADSGLRQQYERNFKLKNDPRVTRTGAWLRKYSLDELPQLINVVRGQMSLVGPRMCTPEELKRYGRCGGLVLSVRPGITGYWQVNGRQNVSFDQHVAMDAFYVKNWSLKMDLGILLQTPRIVISGEGAY